MEKITLPMVKAKDFFWTLAIETKKKDSQKEKIDFIITKFWNLSDTEIEETKIFLENKKNSNWVTRQLGIEFANLFNKASAELTKIQKELEK